MAFVQGGIFVDDDAMHPFKSNFFKIKFVNKYFD